MQNVNKLNVYQEAMKLSTDVYNALSALQDYHRAKSQITGSTSSVVANLAEMAAFDNKNQQRQKVVTCLGETNETETWLKWLSETKHLPPEQANEFQKRNKNIRMMLFNLKKRIEAEMPQQNGSFAASQGRAERKNYQYSRNLK